MFPNKGTKYNWTLVGVTDLLIKLTFGLLRNEVQGAIFAPQVLAGTVDPNVCRQNLVCGDREVIVPSQQGFGQHRVG